MGIPDYHAKTILINSSGHTAQAPYSQHALPPLAGTLISVTGFDPRTKERLAKLIEAGGGAHSPELNTSCTHLIADAAGSPKFRCVYSVSNGSLARV